MNEFKKLIIVMIIEIFKRAKCGFEPFVVGGGYTKIQQYPHSVFLLVNCGSRAAMCGSSILNQDILLTAAHCLERCSNPEVSTFAGAENLEQTTIFRDAEKTVKHEKYNINTVENDIALILLREALPLGKNVKRVIIKRSYRNNKFAIVAGWGVIDLKGNEETTLLKSVKQMIRSQKTCKQFQKHLAKGMMCGHNLDERLTERPAQGDSGSALITPTGYQLGIVSFQTAHYDTVVIYTNVTYYYNWITTNTKRLYCRG